MSKLQYLLTTHIQAANGCAPGNIPFTDYSSASQPNEYVTLVIVHFQVMTSIESLSVKNGILSKRSGVQQSVKNGILSSVQVYNSQLRMAFCQVLRCTSQLRKTFCQVFKCTTNSQLRKAVSFLANLFSSPRSFPTK
jgi:hypothetical protein